MRRWKPSAVLASLIVVVAGGIACAEPFRDGDRVVFWGDSLTRGGSYVELVEDFYLTRYPERTIRFYNAGVSGNTTGGAVRRFSEDVRSRQPTATVILFGMNDCRLYHYAPDRLQQPGYCETLPARETEAFTTFTNGMDRLIGLLQGENPEMRITLASSPPYDETRTKQAGDEVVYVGSNAMLERFSAWEREVSARRGFGFVDLFSPIRAHVASRQSIDPFYTLNRKDRIHPEWQGNFLMAVQFLLQTGVETTISDVKISAQDGCILQRTNADVRIVFRSADELAFDIRAAALPWVAAKRPLEDPAFRELLGAFNRERLAVFGLSDGRWELGIDGLSVGCWTAEELAAGIDLGDNVFTPQHAQAEAIWAANAERCQRERDELRIHASVRWFLTDPRRNVNPDDPAAVRRFYEGLDDESEDGKKGFYQKRIPAYLENLPRVSEWTDRLERDYEVILQMRKSPVRRYRISRASKRAAECLSQDGR